MKQFFAILIFALGGCASSSVMRYTSDTVAINTSAAPVCGEAGAQRVAVQRAAIETIRQGYDGYVVADANYENNVRVTNSGPTYANTTTNGSITTFGNSGYYSGQSRTTFGGNYPIISGRHHQQMIIKMMRRGDAMYDKAIDARGALGPDWKRLAENGEKPTC